MRPCSLWRICVLVLLSCLVCGTLIADMTQEEINRRIAELNAELDQGPSMNRVMEIAGELGDLVQQLNDLQSMPSTKLGLGATPEEDINRQIQSINFIYREAIKNIHQQRGEGLPLIPLSKAARLRGNIVINGAAQESGTNDWVSMKINYGLKESFVGFLMVTEYYDPGSGTITDQKDYAIESISTSIALKRLSGRECVDRDRNSCRKWEQYSEMHNQRLNNFPSIHQDVVNAIPQGGWEGDGAPVILKIDSPSVIFRSSGGGATAGVGCYAKDIDITNSAFTTFIAQGKFNAVQTVGSELLQCNAGSTIEVKIKFCNPEYALMDQCEMIKEMIRNLEYILAFRDAYLANAEAADSIRNLIKMVNQEIQQAHPGSGSLAQRYAGSDAGGYNICTKEVTVPDACKETCSPNPLCQWETEGLRAHEETHKSDMAKPELATFVTEYCKDYHPNVNALNRRAAKIWGDTEFNAHNEHARYILDVVNEQMSLSQGCLFESQLYEKLYRLSSRVQ